MPLSITATLIPRPVAIAMEVGKMPGLSRRLRRIQRVVVRRARALRLVELHGFGPGDLGVVRKLFGGGSGRAAVRHRHDEAVDADHRHRPAVDERQAVLRARSRARGVRARFARASSP